MDHFSLSKYEVQDAGGRQVVVLVTGNREYKRILARAFPTHFMSRTFEDRLARYDWGTYIHNVEVETRNELTTLLDLCTKHILLDDDLTECFALDYHTTFDPAGGYPRTKMGSLVYQAKPYRRTPSSNNIAATDQLARLMVSFIQNHPTYRRSEIVVAAPPSRPDKPFDVPGEIVKRILAACDTMLDGRNYIKKVRETRPMKDCPTIPEKINNVRNAFAMSEDADVRGKTVLLVDDIYQSGFTLNEVGRVLFEAGAESVLGLVATKTGRDM
jgi:predicted amidophosphoribosyltransferase